MTKEKPAMKYYVYIQKEGDSIVYIGKGCGGRLYSLDDRKEEHKVFMKSCIESGNYSFSEIVKTKLSSRQALEEERLLIKQHNPKYNIHKYTSKRLWVPRRKYPNLTPEEAISLGSKIGCEAAKLSPNTGKRGKGKPK